MKTIEEKIRDNAKAFGNLTYEAKASEYFSEGATWLLKEWTGTYSEIEKALKEYDKLMKKK